MKVRVWYKKFNRYLSSKNEWFLDFEGNLYYEDMMDNELLPVDRGLYVIQRFTELYDRHENELWEGDFVILPNSLDFTPHEIKYRVGQWMVNEESLSDFYFDSTSRGNISNVIKVRTEV